MITEIVSVVVGGCVLFAVGGAGFLAGRDAAERKAGMTIANLRLRCMALTSQRDRAQETANRYARILGTVPPVVVREPSWMDEL